MIDDLESIQATMDDRYGERKARMDDQMIPTLAMTRDPRLRRLFALIGKALADEVVADGHLEDDLRDSLLDLAPEYLPPDDTDDPDLRDEWQSFLVNALDV